MTKNRKLSRAQSFEFLVNGLEILIILGWFVRAFVYAADGPEWLAFANSAESNKWLAVMCVMLPVCTLAMYRTNKLQRGG